ncbi:MAG: CHAP domain-containing protein [Butyrivibrio sp.]|nr:CHAP domain-containing protein [Butyrivibrio sp.]
MAKYKKTNNVTGAGRKVNNYEAHNSNKGHSPKHVPKSGEKNSKNDIKATHENNSNGSHKGDKTPTGRNSENHVGTSNHVNPSFIGQKPKVSKTPISMSEDSLKQALSSMNYEVNRKTGTGHVQTASQAQIQAFMRAVATTNNYNSNNFISNDRAKNNIRLSGYSLKQSLENNVSALGNIKNGTISVLGQVSKLSSSDDMGTASVGSLATAGIVGIRGFETAQKISELGIKGSASTINGAVAVTDFTVKGYQTLDRFAGIARVTPLSNNAFNILKSQALGTGLDQTKIAQGLIQTAGNVKGTLKHGINGVQTVIDTTIKTGQQIVMVGQVTRNVFSGAYSGKQLMSATGYGIRKGAAAIGYGAQKLGFNGIKAAAKGVRWTFTSAFPKTFKILGKGSIGTWSFAGKALMGSEDLGLKAVGTAMETTYQTTRVSVKTAKATVKTMQTGGKTIVYAGKGAYRAGKGVVQGAKFIKNKGLKAAWKKARQKGVKAAAKGLKKAANLLLELMKHLGTKMIVPIAVILVIAIGFNLMTAPVMAIAGVFGGVFNDEDTGDEVNIDAYLNDTTKGIPAKTDALKNEIVGELSAAASTYNIARFRANTPEGAGGLITDHSYGAISAVFPTDTEIIEMVKPLFQSVILMNYENSPTDAECQVLLDHIIDKMFVITQVDTTEYCGQDLVSGEGDIDNCGSCGEVHAHSDCPNPLPMAYHSSYTCDECCYYYCPGHDHTDSSGNSYTTYCSGCVHACNGHIDCGGHSVTTFTLNCDGIYTLVQEYFQDPIDMLEGTARTEDQEEQLSMLKSYYEIFDEMSKLVNIGGYSGSLAVEDLSGVNWVDGTRTGCDEIVEYAKQFLGNKGGRTFWSYLGFGGRVAWCACFVYYIMRNSGYGASYPSSVNYAYCPDMTEAFSNVGRFAGRDFRDIVAGDVIYFDYKGQGESHHTGIVIGRDETTVYTIEGNSGDQVKINSYDLNSSVIFGYGLMNY